MLLFLRYTRLDLKVCFDTGHAHMAGGVQSAFRTLQKRVAAMHIHDNHGEKDEHLLPYEGEIDWAQAIPDFRSAGGQFPIFFELSAERKEPKALARISEVTDRFEAIP
jgi:sugar phosphate isomerase/epimerase